MYTPWIASIGVGHALELPQRLCTWEAETDTYSVVPHSLPRCTFVSRGDWFRYKPKAAMRWNLRQGDLQDGRGHFDDCICCALASARGCTRLAQGMCREGGCADIIHAAGYLNRRRVQVTRSLD